MNLNLDFETWRDPRRRFALNSKRDHIVRGDGAPYGYGELEKYRPFAAEIPNKLLMAFAKLVKPDDAVAFVNDFGPVTPAGFISKSGDPVRDILRAAKTVRTILEAAADAEFGDLPTSIEDFWPEADSNAVQVKVRLVPNMEAARAPLLVGSAHSLRDAIFIILGSRLANGDQFRICKHCQTVFDVGPGAASKRNLKAAYCSDDHREQFHLDHDKRK